jgi:hypothetical protein
MAPGCPHHFGVRPPLSQEGYLVAGHEMVPSPADNEDRLLVRGRFTIERIMV